MSDEKQEITWDLTELFSSPNDPSVEKALTEAKAWADDFEKAYRGKIASLNPAQSATAASRSLRLSTLKMGDVSLFASLSFSANMTLPEVQALYDRVSKFEASWESNSLSFRWNLARLLKPSPN